MIARFVVKPVVRPVIRAATSAKASGADAGYTFLRDPLDGGAVVKDGIDNTKVQSPK